MKVKHFLYLILFISIAAISSCNKEKEPLPERPIPEYKLPDDFLRYFAFKPGSYWIYKNTKNGMLDTVTVTKYGFGYHTFSSVGGTNFYKYQDFSGEMTSSAYPAVYDYKIAPFNNSIDNNKSIAHYYTELGSFGPWGGGGTAYIMFYPFNINENYDISSGKKIIFKSKDTTILVNNIMIDSVQLFYVGYCSMFYNAQVNLYYKKNVGLVKRTNLSNGDDWEMISYSVLY